MNKDFESQRETSICVTVLWMLLFTTNLRVEAQSDPTFNQIFLRKTVVSQANQMASLYKVEDYTGYLRFIHSAIVNAVGGENKMIELLNAQNVQLKTKGIRINSIVFDSPSEIIKSKDELQCVISQHTELISAKGRVLTYTTIIAISLDHGKNWKFIDTSNMDIDMVRKLFPNLSRKITLPPKQKPIIYPV